MSRTTTAVHGWPRQPISSTDHVVRLRSDADPPILIVNAAACWPGLVSRSGASRETFRPDRTDHPRRLTRTWWTQDEIRAPSCQWTRRTYPQIRQWALPVCSSISRKLVQPFVAQ